MVWVIEGEGFKGEVKEIGEGEGGRWGEGGGEAGEVSLAAGDLESDIGRSIESAA